MTLTETSNAEDEIILGVHGKPHDPNSLEVDQPYLCPCRSGEVLTYQVNFQNQGDGVASRVNVDLKEYAPYLDPASIIPLNNERSYLHKAAIDYDPGTGIFTLSGIELPGIGQWRAPVPIQSWETMDYFKFSVQKQPCTPLGTVIAPKAVITFYDSEGNAMAPIETNAGKTTVVGGMKEQNCNLEPNPDCPDCGVLKVKGKAKIEFCPR